MSDPMDRPPLDYGSDRFDYVEVEAPADVTPSGPWLDRLLAAPCMDCRANVFLRWMHLDKTPDDPDGWYVTIAHDSGCPAQTARERGQQ